MSLENYSYLIITCKPKPSQPSTTGNVNVCQGWSLCCVGGDVWLRKLITWFTVFFWCR